MSNLRLFGENTDHSWPEFCFRTLLFIQKNTEIKILVNVNIEVRQNCIQHFKLQNSRGSKVSTAILKYKKINSGNNYYFQMNPCQAMSGLFI